MKQIVRKTSGILLAALSLMACKNEFVPYDAVYMTDAQSSPDKTITIDTPPAGTSFTVSSSVAASSDMVVYLTVRPDLIEQYNKKYGKNYKMAPEGTFELSANNTTIATGRNVSEPVELTITSMDGFEEGSTYCVPVSIESVSSMQVLEPSRTLFVVLKTPVISKAIRLGSNMYWVPSFQQDPNLAALAQITLEARVYVERFAQWDPFISSVMGIEGVCGMRFGDVKVSPNAVQICHESYQPAAEQAKCETNRWYHLAAVWSGKTWDIFIDGKYITGTPVAGETIDLTSDNSGGFQVGASYGQGRPLEGYISEIRVWTRALSESEISNNMNYVEPNSEGLLAYWRMNRTESPGVNIIPDETGHGYSLVGRNKYFTPTYMDTKWM